MVFISNNSKYRRIAVLITVFCLSVNVFGQVDKLKQASELLANKKFEEAQTIIDEVVVHESTKNDARAWYTRGYIYKGLYKANRNADTLLKYRKPCLTSFLNVVELDNSGKYVADSKKNMNFIVKSTYNHALQMSSEFRMESADRLFQFFSTYIGNLDPSFDKKSAEIQYYLARGEVFMRNFMTHTKRMDYLENTRASYDHVFTLDPENFEATINMGVLYYNEGVVLIDNMDFIDIEELMRIEDKSIELFKKALPYLLKAHQQEPRNKNILEGLQGIYFSLKEFEKSEEYKNQLEQLNDK